MKKCIAFAALTAIFFCLLLAGCALEGPAESAGSVSGHSESSAPNDAEASGGELAQTPSGPHTDHIESIGGDAALPAESSADLNLAENADTLTMEVSPAKAGLDEQEFTLAFRNSEGTQFFYGLEYTLEYDSGEWERIDFADGFEIQSVEYLGADGTEMQISLKNHDFACKAGRYRISKSILGKTIYAEFELVG
ncbi:MAG: immunoglobulin-like domain-containing protein [Candidatus Woodwardiibium sp.]